MASSAGGGRLRRVQLSLRLTLFSPLALLLGLVGCGDQPPANDPASGSATQAGSNPTRPSPPPAADRQLVTIACGSGKQAWMTEALARFQASKPQVDGHPIEVKAVYAGSGELVDNVLTGKLQAQILSPDASLALAAHPDLLSSSDPLVLTPLVVACWEPVAKNLGWPGKPLGWSDLARLATAGEQATAFGRFKLGHTHPEYSNSGAMAVLAMTHAALGSVAPLTEASFEDPRVGTLLAAVERSVVHYGRSTKLFMDTLLARGPGRLSAVVTYENEVVRVNEAIAARGNAGESFRLVAIYPREGTYWCDHPAGLVAKPWVTGVAAKAAQQVLAFLKARPQQELALQFGLRPADPAVAIGDDQRQRLTGLGIDLAQPSTVLPTPSAVVAEASLRAWRAHKKTSDLLVVIDTSGSMQDEDRIAGARAGARALVEQLGANDRLTLVRFSTAVGAPFGPLTMDAAGKTQANAWIDQLFPDGRTALYQAVEQGLTQMAQRPDDGRIRAVVVLTDGEDTITPDALPGLTARITQAAKEGGQIRLFTIAYGKDANRSALKSLATATDAKAYEGSTNDAVAIFRDIATFF